MRARAASTLAAAPRRRARRRRSARAARSPGCAYYAQQHDLVRTLNAARLRRVDHHRVAAGRDRRVSAQGAGIPPATRSASAPSATTAGITTKLEGCGGFADGSNQIMTVHRRQALLGQQGRSSAIHGDAAALQPAPEAQPPGVRRRRLRHRHRRSCATRPACTRDQPQQERADVPRLRQRRTAAGSSTRCSSTRSRSSPTAYPCSTKGAVDAQGKEVPVHRRRRRHPDPRPAGHRVRDLARPFAGRGVGTSCPASSPCSCSPPRPSPPPRRAPPPTTPSPRRRARRRSPPTAVGRAWSRTDAGGRSSCGCARPAATCATRRCRRRQPVGRLPRPRRERRGHRRVPPLPRERLRRRPARRRLRPHRDAARRLLAVLRRGDARDLALDGRLHPAESGAATSPTPRTCARAPPAAGSCTRGACRRRPGRRASGGRASSSARST